MNGFLCLLLTFSLLVLTQIQTGVLGNTTVAGSSAAGNGSSAGGGGGGGGGSGDGAPATTTTAGTTSTATTTTSTAKTTPRPTKGGAPALSNMDGGSVLFFLTNTLIHLFYLS